MTVLETLSEEQKALIDEATDKITLEILESLDYGDEINLTDDVVLYHYCEDEIVVVNLKDEWEEVLQVQWNVEADEIVFEAL